MKLFLLPIVAAFAVPAAAQTPLCAWNGSGLVCPGGSDPAPVPLYQPVRPAPPSLIQDNIARMSDQADFDRALALSRAEHDLQQRQLAARAQANGASGYCSGGETLNTDPAESGLELLHARCRAPRR